MIQCNGFVSGYRSSSQGAEERDQVLLLLHRELESEYQVEEFNRIVECQQPIVVKVGRRSPQGGSIPLVNVP
jgi:hypothetical protein